MERTSGCEQGQSMVSIYGCRVRRGGNRYLSEINLVERPELARYFPGKEKVQAGVCSLQLAPSNQPWVVCPRRLLALRENAHSNHQAHVRSQLAQYAGLKAGDAYRAWSEVKIKVATTDEHDEQKSFDYTFDYVVAGSERKRLAEIAELIGKSERDCLRSVETNGYTVAMREGEYWVEDFPAIPIIIVEVMTSSTSGGNKRRRTQIGMACEDAILDPENHNGPGINYRQVWARMVSQLIVKSQVALAWNGRTFWVLQDVLARYISRSTALNLNRYIADHPNEVNILSLGYGDLEADEVDSGEPIAMLKESTFYSGPITEASNEAQEGGFIEIVKIAALPPKGRLFRALFLKKPCGGLSL